MKTHELKIWPEYFEAVTAGQLRGCARRHDRDYEVGDIVILKEYNPVTYEYTGQFTCKRISYILRGGVFGIDPEYSVLSLESSE